MTVYIRRFRDITLSDVPWVGGKKASLDEMYRELSPRGVRVPNGFAVTAEAYRDFLREAHLDEEIRTGLAAPHPQDVELSGALLAEMTGSSGRRYVPLVATIGHILGSANVRLDLGQGVDRRCIVFSGDIGRYGAPILPEPGGNRRGRLHRRRVHLR
jgi:Pyruvate phosphate dikinase, AMP/ATP-binding domain